MNTPEEIIQKIKAALRLARRASTAGEQAAAEAAAKRLADKNGIALGELEVEESRVCTGKYDDDNWLSASYGMEIGFITAVLRNHFGIVLVQTRRADGKIRLSWIGTAINVDIAKHVYAILLRECRKDWGEARIVKRQAKEALKGIRISPSLRGLAPGASSRMNQIAALRDLSKQAFYAGWFSAVNYLLTLHPLRNDLDQLEAERKSANDFLDKMKAEGEIADKQKNPKISEKDRLSFRLGASAGETIRLNRPCTDAGYRGAPREIGETARLESKK